MSITEQNILTEHQSILHPRCRHIAVGKGWLELVYNTLSDMRSADANVRVVQIKEKFGGLRIYHEGGSSAALSGIVANAEDLASTTCDVCGGMAHVDTVMDNGWMRTRCPLHVNGEE